MRHDDVPRNNHQRMVQTAIQLGAGLPMNVGWLLGGFALRMLEKIFCIRLMLRSPEAVHLLHLQLHPHPYPATPPAPLPPPPPPLLAAASPRQLSPSLFTRLSLCLALPSLATAHCVLLRNGNRESLSVVGAQNKELRTCGADLARVKGARTSLVAVVQATLLKKIWGRIKQQHAAMLHSQMLVVSCH